MPYTPPKSRRKLGPGDSGAEFAYHVAQLVDEYIARNGLCYDTITDVRGGLSGVRGEFDRRFAFPYEDIKLRTNGEVFFGCVEALAQVRP